MAGEFHPSSTHPPLPPTTEDNRFTALRLLRSRRVGATTFHRLISEHGSISAALDALPETAKAAGVDGYRVCPEGVIVKELQAGKQAGAHLLLHGHAGYPRALMDREDAPPILWALGDLRLLDCPMIAIVGARNASALGARMARALARDLGAEGYVIVSGLARGIDAAAHKAALEHGTVAVQAGGIDNVYPRENADLAMEIAEHGLRLSEQPPGLQPTGRHFPARNRIVAGLGRACVVVEAAAKSGSLITARLAAEAGRDVMAVPGHPFDPRASGCNMLIRDGATLVRRAEDVIEALGPLARAAAPKTRPNGSAPKRKTDAARVSAPHQGPPSAAGDLPQLILAKLGPEPVAEDDLLRDLAQPPELLLPALTELELTGEIERHAGGLLSRTA